jgi:hypothetical protein
MSAGKSYAERARLEAIRANTIGGVARAARSTSCGRCRSPVMVGLDDDMCALSAVVDVYPLSPAGEVVALMSGRRTYSLTWAGGRYEIDRRDSYRIEGMAPGDRSNVDVVVNHECGTPKFQSLSTIDRGRKREERPVDPPF